MAWKPSNIIRFYYRSDQANCVVNMSFDVPVVSALIRRIAICEPKAWFWWRGGNENTSAPVYLRALKSNVMGIASTTDWTNVLLLELRSNGRVDCGARRIRHQILPRRTYASVRRPSVRHWLRHRACSCKPSLPSTKRTQLTRFRMQSGSRQT